MFTKCELYFSPFGVIHQPARITLPRIYRSWKKYHFFLTWCDSRLCTKEKNLRKCSKSWINFSNSMVYFRVIRPIREKSTIENRSESVTGSHVCPPHCHFQINCMRLKWTSQISPFHIYFAQFWFIFILPVPLIEMILMCMLLHYRRRRRRFIHRRWRDRHRHRRTDCRQRNARTLTNDWL